MMEISPDGLALIAMWESLRLRVYKDPVGLLTIGYGHLLTRSELASGKIVIGGESVCWRDGLTPDQANTLLRQDAEAAETGIRSALPPDVVDSLTQHQYDALVSFVFNVGSGAFARSTLRKRILSGQHDDVPYEMSKWKYAAGQILPGLINRRRHEGEM